MYSLAGAAFALRWERLLCAGHGRCCFICACLDQPTCPGIAEGDDGTAGYATRTPGGVGGALSDGRPYPYSDRFRQQD